MNDDYRKTSEQVDGVSTTVISTLLTLFIVSQNFVSNSINQSLLKVVSVFALSTLFFHFASFVTAHYAQINKVQNKKVVYKLLSWLTKKLNGTVYVMIFIMFLISGAIIILN